VVAAATGGLPALLADGRGWCVDGDDLRALAAATLEALGPEPAEHAERGAHDAAGEGDEGDRRAAALDAHVRRHHDVAVVGPAWLAVVLDR
jgi:glycosyltransferase involved in cell wall biosynthesis